jgi:serine/threonine protein kinase
LNRIKNEIFIHLGMKNENIVELYFYFEDSNNFYLVMELCENGELYKLLKKVHKFRECEVKHYFRQILNAILYLQKHEIIHRDLKLSNILLSNNFEIIKLTDFGLSLKLDSIHQEQHTQLGTPNYMAQ